MKQFYIKVRVNGAWLSTSIFADNAIHARLLAEYEYGIGNVSVTSAQGYSMKVNEITSQPTQAKTPEQLRIDTLQKQKETASNALKAERNRQKLQKAQAQIRQVNAANTSFGV